MIRFPYLQHTDRFTNINTIKHYLMSTQLFKHKLYCQVHKTCKSVFARMLAIRYLFFISSVDVFSLSNN